MREELFSLLISGTVERRVQVRASSLAEAEARGASEWAALVGGHVGTAEVLELERPDAD